MDSRHFVFLEILTPIVVVTLFVLSPVAQAQSEQLAATPPMGWNDYNHFNNHIDEAEVEAEANAMVSSGMRDAGYIYVNIDAFWEGPRDAHGNISSNARFPDMKALADYIHSLGLKFGLYSSPGPSIDTYNDYPGSYEHEQQDADTYARWGADYLKYDLMTYYTIMRNESRGDAAKESLLLRQAYARMHRAVLNTRRPMVFSLCEYGFDAPWKWGPSVGGNLWRTTTDVQDNYASVENNGFVEAGLAKYAGPGHWNDPDMLEIGNGGMSPDEERTQMSLWSILAAPLIAGNDLTKMSDMTKSILLNREVIAVDQDTLGKEGDRVRADGPYEVWAKPLSGGAKAVGLFNRNGYPCPITVNFKEIGYEGPVHVRDLWAHKGRGTLTGSYTATVPGHGVVMIRISK
jgi:alpha-galactosidase